MAEGLTPCYSYGTYGTNPSNWPAGWNEYWQNHVNVSCDWNAACYRLPTEMEWMYAAKGGGLSADYIYSGSNNIDEVGWCYENWGQYYLLTKPVGGLAPNELGTYDMSGNMWEWCWDIKGDYPAGDQTNPTGAVTGNHRVARGGSWYALASSCTVFVRGEDVANSDGTGRVGFRVVKVFP